MPLLDFNTIASLLEDTLGVEALNRIGKETGQASRLRDIHPARLAIATIGALASQNVDSLSDILLKLNSIAPISVQYKPFHNQFSKPAYPLFNKTIFESLMHNLILNVLTPVSSSLLAGFDDIILQDGSSFAIDSKLAEYFPGRFSHLSPAAVELHVEMSLLTGRPIRVVLTPDKESERAHLPQPDSLIQKLFMADADYEDLLFFNRVAKAGGSFICRLKGNSNPKVLAAWVRGERYKFDRRIPLKDLRNFIEGRDAEFDVQWVRKGQKG